MNNTAAYNALKKEAALQNTLYSRLKRWLAWGISCSTLGLVLILYGAAVHSVLRTAGIVLFVLSVLAVLIMGLGLKNGRNNLLKLFDLMDQARNSEKPETL